eukprot:TRINITY_DN1278_c0_g3_i1.p1 TRINITY_DN1278_c0_g3~~TRINITY_DN1278_c0_g3_i1.p1  ORF type:complete len:152 (-),score=54.32 TRINITY_DN1278_c0_g3_i1:130-585(-)
MPKKISLVPEDGGLGWVLLSYLLYRFQPTSAEALGWFQQQIQKNLPSLSLFSSSPSSSPSPSPSVSSPSLVALSSSTVPSPKAFSLLKEAEEKLIYKNDLISTLSLIEEIRELPTSPLFDDWRRSALQRLRVEQSLKLLLSELPRAVASVE